MLTALAPDDRIDPVGTDNYVTKALKYPWAPDTYLAFPSMFFHYDGEGPPEREILGTRERLSGTSLYAMQFVKE